ncbi:MAG TPA: CHAP domain-containing protein [Sphingomonas sp.]|jgi:surface antigen
MNFKRLAARFALVSSCVLMTATPAQARFWQCAPYARLVSGVQIFGNAHTWWDQAAGRYERGAKPIVGAVMAMARTARMRLGHVATVAKVVSDREVILDHANWTRRGGVEQAARAIDVSPAGDWSQVKVTYGRGLGTSVYPTKGFIYGRLAQKDAVAPVTFASADGPKPMGSLSR